MYSVRHNNVNVYLLFLHTKLSGFGSRCKTNKLFIYRNERQNAFDFLSAAHEMLVIIPPHKLRAERHGSVKIHRFDQWRSDNKIRKTVHRYIELPWYLPTRRQTSRAVLGNEAAATDNSVSWRSKRRFTSSLHVVVVGKTKNASLIAADILIFSRNFYCGLTVWKHVVDRTDDKFIVVRRIFSELVFESTCFLRSGALKVRRS